MTSDDGHHLYERRRLRRRIGFWRLIAIAAVVLSTALFFWDSTPGGSYVARYSIVGAILDDPERDDFLRSLAEDDEVEALVLRINSPGGSVTGSEALFEAVRSVADRKPVVAVLGEVAASGGYIAALAADHIIARGGTITGSIGVIAEYPNIEELLSTVGIAFNRVASSPLKAEPSPLRAPSEAALEAQEAVIDDAYQWFLDLVATRRDLTAERARDLGDGRIYSGRQAVAEGLIDDIGAEPAALTWLQEVRGLSPDLALRDVEPEEPFSVLGMVDGVNMQVLLSRLFQGPRLMAVMR
jgi:protease-4